MRSTEAAGLSDTLEDGTDRSDAPDEPRIVPDASILNTCRQALSDSTSFLDTNWRKQWDDNHDNFNSKHPKGSRYYSDAYKHRSKLFLPKTRSVGMRWESAVSSAIFSTRDVASIEAENQDDPNQAAAARLWKEAFQYRLKETMPWYITVLGAAQDAFKSGVCISHNHWIYREDDEGNVLKDTLACDLRPVDNVRFSPAADWRDPINDSPYLIDIMSMRVDEIVGKMQSGEWAQTSVSTIKAATRPYNERSDNADEADTVEPHEIAYVYKFIYRLNGIDYLWFVLGMEHMLTHPTPLSEVNPKGIRNYTLGCMTFDTHQVIPQSPVEQLSSLQADINEIRNSRKDNVRQVINKRKYVNRSAGIDMAALLRGVPGAIIPMNNPATDVREEDTSDVTASAYKEEEFANAGFDEIAGSFNQSSINTNRRMGETAAGMELMAADSNLMTEYKIELFSKTWLEPTLKQLLLLEQHYDRDWQVISQAAQGSGLQDEGIVEITENLLMEGITLSVNVGVDATNPARKVDKLTVFANSLMSFGQQPNAEEFVKELAGAMGFDNGTRFIGEAPQPQSDPASDAKMAELEFKQQESQWKMQEAQMKAEILKGQLEMQLKKLEEESHLKQLGMQQAADDQDKDRESREHVAALQAETQRMVAGVNAETKLAEKLADMDMAKMNKPDTTNE